MELEVLPPAGRFTPERLEGDLVLFAGGSGITPLLSILKSVLFAGSGNVTLCYANRDEQSVIFAAELDELRARFAPRLSVVHWLESKRGLPDAAALRELVDHAPATECFACGPEPFMLAARTAMADRGLARDRIHLERFTSLSGNPFAGSDTLPHGDRARTALVEVELEGRTRELCWPQGARLLDVLRAAGLNAPSSCGEGVCAACECRVVAGEVRMVDNRVLEADDLEQGYMLACQAVPVTDVVRISYA